MILSLDFTPFKIQKKIYNKLTLYLLYVTFSVWNSKQNYVNANSVAYAT